MASNQLMDWSTNMLGSDEVLPILASKDSPLTDKWLEFTIKLPHLVVLVRLDRPFLTHHETLYTRLASPRAFHHSVQPMR
jgi:hypothetical protein